MKYKIAIYLLAACSLSSCHIYKSYERPELPTDSLYRKPDIPLYLCPNHGIGKQHLFANRIDYVDWTVI